MECDYFRSQGIWYGCVIGNEVISIRFLLEYLNTERCHDGNFVVTTGGAAVCGYGKPPQIARLVGLTLGRQARRWSNVGPTILAFCDTGAASNGKRLAPWRFSVFSGVRGCIAYCLCMCMFVHFVVGIDETLIDLKSPGAGYSLITIDLWPSVIAELARTEVSVYDYSTAVQQRPLLLTWINLNPSMDKKVTTCPCSKMWDEIAHPFPNFKCIAFEVLGMDAYFHCILYNGWNDLSIMRLKLMHARRRGPDVTALNGAWPSDFLPLSRLKIF